MSKPALLYVAILGLLPSCSSSPGSSGSLPSCSSPGRFPLARQSYPYQLYIFDKDGAGGYQFEYYVNDESVTVVYSDDFGSARMEFLKRTLTEWESKAWREFMDAFDFESLDDEYMDPGFDDGLQRTYQFNFKGKKTVHVDNVGVVNLELVAMLVNQLVPRAFHMLGAELSDEELNELWKSFEDESLKKCVEILDAL